MTRPSSAGLVLLAELAALDRAAGGVLEVLAAALDAPRRSTSTPTTAKPLRANTSAMPAPIVPSPTTPMVVNSRVRRRARGWAGHGRILPRIEDRAASVRHRESGAANRRPYDRPRRPVGPGRGAPPSRTARAAGDARPAVAVAMDHVADPLEARDDGPHRCAGRDHVTAHARPPTEPAPAAVARADVGRDVGIGAAVPLPRVLGPAEPRRAGSRDDVRRERGLGQPPLLEPDVLADEALGDVRGRRRRRTARAPQR